MARGKTAPDFMIETERTERHDDECRGRFRLVAGNPKRSMTERVRDALGLECMQRMADEPCPNCEGDFQRCLFEIRGEDILQVGAECVNGHFLVDSDFIAAAAATGLEVGKL